MFSYQPQLKVYASPVIHTDITLLPGIRFSGTLDSTARELT